MKQFVFVFFGEERTDGPGGPGRLRLRAGLRDLFELNHVLRSRTVVLIPSNPYPSHNRIIFNASSCHRSVRVSLHAPGTQSRRAGHVRYGLGRMRSNTNTDKFLHTTNCQRRYKYTFEAS
jgi:hypothetical protein